MSTDKPFDIMACGHFHQSIWTTNMIINGSMIGYNEYAYGMNLRFERPGQWAFVVHPDHGAVHSNIILCDAYEGGQLK
jgi:hypothetical protein